MMRCLLALLPCLPLAAQLHVERQGLLVIEAEAFADSHGYSVARDAQAAGGAYVQSGGAIDYRVLIVTRGRYHLHLRTRSEDDKGNSCFLTLDGTPVLTPPGCGKDGHGVIQTQIGTWGWFTKWRETDNAVTVDLMPGAHVLRFSPREPQQLDRIVLRHVALGQQGQTSHGGGLKGEGPASTIGLLDLGEAPDDRSVQGIERDLHSLRLGRALKAIERALERDGGGEAAAHLAARRRLVTGWSAALAAEAEAAASRGDLLAASDRLAILAELLQGHSSADGYAERRKELAALPDHAAGERFWHLVLTMRGKDRASWEQGLAAFRQRHPDSWYAANAAHLIPAP